MATLSINDILDRYNNAFGYSAMKVAPRLIKAGFEVSNFMLSNIPVYPESDTSFADMKFESSRNPDAVFHFGIPTMENGHPAFPFVKSRENEPQKFLAPPPMVRFTRGKHVKRTPIDRSEHEVVEHFGLKPWEIKVSGILVDVTDHQYPSAHLKEIDAMFRQSGTFHVSGRLFDDLGIQEVFIDGGLDVGFVEGYVDTVKFAFTAISIEPTEFLAQGF